MAQLTPSELNPPKSLCNHSHLHVHFSLCVITVLNGAHGVIFLRYVENLLEKLNFLFSFYHSMALIVLIAIAFEKKEPCSESFIKIHSLLTEILKFLFSFDHSIGLILLILTTSKNKPCSEKFCENMFTFNHILKFLFSFDHSIVLIVHHQMSRAGQCCFNSKMSKKISC